MSTNVIREVFSEQGWMDSFILAFSVHCGNFPLSIKINLWLQHKSDYCTWMNNKEYVVDNFLLIPTTVSICQTALHTRYWRKCHFRCYVKKRWLPKHYHFSKKQWICSAIWSVNNQITFLPQCCEEQKSRLLMFNVKSYRKPTKAVLFGRKSNETVW